MKYDVEVVQRIPIQEYNEGNGGLVILKAINKKTVYFTLLTMNLILYNNGRQFIIRPPRVGGANFSVYQVGASRNAYRYAHYYSKSLKKISKKELSLLMFESLI